MNGLSGDVLRGLDPGDYVIGASFTCNAGSNPTALLGPKGFQFTVTYAATGLFTVTIASALGRLANAPRSIIVGTECTAVATWFEAFVVGGNTLNASARQFVIQTHQAGVAFQPTALSTNRVNFLIYAHETGA